MEHLSENLKKLIIEAFRLAESRRHEFVSPDHFRYVLFGMSEFRESLDGVMRSPIPTPFIIISDKLDKLERVPDNIDYVPELSILSEMLLDVAIETAASSSQEKADIPHFINAYPQVERVATEDAVLRCLDSNYPYFLNQFISEYDPAEDVELLPFTEIEKLLEKEYDLEKVKSGEALGDDDDYDYFDEFPEDFGFPESPRKPEGNKDWHKLVVCINDNLDGKNPLIGRKSELERTLLVLSRKDKNNPLHIGEPGVGKTAIIYGLARMIEQGDVPPNLAGARIYAMEMGSLVAGTKMRGEFEERLQKILKGVAGEKNAILYIDEIHTLIGAGATSGNDLDASNILKRYLEEGSIRFIGATTYDDYKRSIANNRAFARRFQEIDVPEPTVEEAREILAALIPEYEKFHEVTYQDGVADYAVALAARHIHGRFLPDKAIDLIDEAGAWRRIHPDADGEREVDKKLIGEIAERIAKAKIADASADPADDETRDVWNRLDERIRSRVYGQDKAVEDVVEAVLMSRAGLGEEGKPIGSFLFVGPTGVGKTELSVVLAEELDVPLIRFDMSEYSEKHSVAKLIGAPAGYVGYDDGGLLTDAVRRSPGSVLLLDEIEKAHPDIFNILLQIMDYGRLTDNQGREAQFGNVILIMTSNAGAQFAMRARPGFESEPDPGAEMGAEIKRLFKPEFINRLSAVVPFNRMDSRMASMILDKSIRRLSEKLSKRGVTLEVSDAARALLLKKGITREYGARELDRVIDRMVKRPLSREILFGKLRNGGQAKVMGENDQIIIKA